MRHLWRNESFQKYFQNTGWLFLEKVARLVVTLTVWALVIRYLGPEQFGVFSYALSFIFLFGMLVDLGMEQVLVKDLVEQPGRSNVFLGSAFVLRILGFSLASILIAISVHFWVKDPVTKIVIYIMSGRLFFMAFNNIDSYFQSRVLSKYTVYSQMLSLCLTSVLCLLFVYGHKSLFYFVWIVVLEAASTVGWLMLFYQRFSKSRWIFDPTVIRQLLYRSWPLVISGFAISIYMRLDQLMIKHMIGNAAVGQFAVAVRVSEAFYFIPMAATASLFPAIVLSKTKDQKIYYNRLTSINTLLIWISLAISVMMSMYGSSLIRLLFGDNYLPAIPVLLIHIWASIFVFLGVMRSKWAINEGLQNLIMVYTILGAVINVALNVVLIPHWGILGAAIATVVAQCFVATISNLLHPKSRPMFFLQLNAFNPVYLFRNRW